MIEEFSVFYFTTQLLFLAIILVQYLDFYYSVRIFQPPPRKKVQMSDGDLPAGWEKRMSRSNSEFCCEILKNSIFFFMFTGFSYLDPST